ncbi:hypothetical protein BDN72DRAFT_762223 [Pluteus cervinus]|uniref:Uncharacterized protein n=1 Tax=Pluteus cervinus TaxID=181527 RepID=A0ACD3B5P3_9AGAR|nr:hypothetical protein BDN72DRAFT_762223 [Pluteus cervinus]
MFIRSFLGLVVLHLATVVAGSYQYLTLSGTNITFAYLDSGPVASSNSYTTLMLLHGTGFNSLVFNQILPLAKANNLRIVAINRRDYAPTTLLTSAEIAVMSQGDTGAQTYFQQRGNEIGLFIDKWLQQNTIPTVHNGQGGIAIVGWSLGTVTAHSFLAHLDTLPAATLNRLAPYIHTVLLHDTFATAVAFPNPPQFDISLWFIIDPTQRFTAFKEWVTSYYDSTDFNPSTGTINTIDFNNPNPAKPKTFSTTPASIMNTMLNEAAFAGSEAAVLFFNQTAFSKLIRRALFDPTVASKLPNVKARYFYGGETAGILILASWEITETPPSYYNGVTARNIKLHYGDQGNHFLFWDKPQYALSSYISAINS